MRVVSNRKVLDASSSAGQESLAFRVDRGQLTRTAVHSTELQECGVFSATAQRLPKEARRTRRQIIHCNARVS